MRQLCWSKKPYKSFFTVASAYSAPYVSTELLEYWRGIDNRTAKRYIGKMALVHKNGLVKDSNDNLHVENSVTGYVLNMEKIAGVNIDIKLKCIYLYLLIRCFIKFTTNMMKICQKANFQLLK